MFYLVRGSVYLLIVFGAPFSFLYTGLVNIFTDIVFIFTHTHTHISKIITMNVKMVTRPVYKKPKEAPKTTRRGKHSP